MILDGANLEMLGIVSSLILNSSAIFQIIRGWNNPNTLAALSPFFLLSWAFGCIGMICYLALSSMLTPTLLFNYGFSALQASFLIIMRGVAD